AHVGLPEPDLPRYRAQPRRGPRGRPPASQHHQPNPGPGDLNMKNMRIDLRGKRVASTQRQWWGMPAGFLAAMLALPATAGIDIPDDPLTTGARVPPNILFVLDDSGSMAFDAMPANSVSSNWTTRTYVHNAVYYNPAKTYLPWV